MILFFIITFFIAYLVYDFVTKNFLKPSNSPPGMWSLPIVGSLPFFSRPDCIHLELTELTAKYGNIYSFMAGSRFVVVLNGQKMIRQAFTSNATSLKLAGRTPFHVEKHYTNPEGRGIVFRQYSLHYKLLRAKSLETLKKLGYGSESVIEYRILKEIKKILADFSTNSGKTIDARYLLALPLMKIIHGLMFSDLVETNEAECKDFIRQVNTIINSADPIVELFPFIENLPPFRGRLQKSKMAAKKIQDLCMKRIHQSQQEQNGSDNNFIKEFVKMISNAKAVEEIDDIELSYIVRDLMIAGLETTATMLAWIFTTLGNNPDIISKIQTELDQVMSRDRLPKLEDRKHLPYLQAAILEVMRLLPSVPLGVPRQALCDVTLCGYNIPANAQIIPNIWSSGRDPEIFSDPEKFDPQRFLNENGELTGQDNILIFSAGKRSCLGELLARQEIFLFTAAIVQNFNIEPPEGAIKIDDRGTMKQIYKPTNAMMKFTLRNI